MNESEYAAVLRTHLDAAAGTAAERLAQVVGAVPGAARAVVLTVFPDQDGEGTFSVVASLDGPDAFVLDKAIEPHRVLFEVVHTEDGPEPAVPLFGRAGFSVQDVIVDTAATWAEGLWSRVARGRSPVPGVVEGADGYGTTVPITLDA